MESNGYLWDKKQEQIIEHLKLDTVNIDNFRLATKDPNEIHNPEKNKNPVALGFQLEALVSLYAKQQKPINNHFHLEKIETKFRNFLCADQTFYLSLNFENNKMEVNINDADSTFATVNLYYSQSLPVQYSESNQKPVKLTNKMVRQFYRGLNIQPKNNLPKFLIPSLSSYAISREIKKLTSPEKQPIYVKHTISFFSQIEKIKRNSKVYLSLDNHKSTKRMDVINVSGNDKKHNKVFDAELLVSFIPQEKFYMLTK